MDLKENQEKFFTYDRVHPWETVRLSFVEKLLRKYNPVAKRVLDIGCGNCFVANSLIKKSGIQIAAVDNMFTPELIAKLRGQLTGQQIELFQNFADIHDRAFDTVMLLDVIEHIEDDKAALRELRNSDSVTPGAVFIITVPAFSALFSSHDRKLGHYRRYTASRLCRLAGESGTEIIDYGYFFVSLLFARILQAAWEKLFHRKESESVSGVGEWNKGSIITAIIVFCLKADILITQCFKKIKIIIPGLSCYLICRKLPG